MSRSTTGKTVFVFLPASTTSQASRKTERRMIKFWYTASGNIRSGAVMTLLCVFAAALAHPAELHGKVADQSGALVPRAAVTVTCTGGKQETVASDSAGNFALRGLPAGACTVAGQSKQLATAAPIPVVLHEGDQAIDIVLVVPAITQQVTVSDEASQLSTEGAGNASGLVLKGKSLDALSDNPDDLQSDLQALAGPSAGPNGGAIFIDGFSGGELPPKESIREIHLNQDPFSPEYDTIGYGRIDILTKPGSDRYRATVDYNLGDAVWNSRNPYSATKAPFLLNEFEGNGGGPLGRRASFILDAQHNMVNNGSVVNALIVDPSSYSIVPFNNATVTVQRLTSVAPRIDFALNENNTLTARYGWTHADIQDAGVGAFDLASRGFHTFYTNQTAQIGETAIFGKLVNQLRFQYYRTAISQDANSSNAATLVLGAFNDGGAQIGQSADTQNNEELQNYTSLLFGSHFIKFGVRLRIQNDNNISPLDFNGAFTFGGIASAPELDANNQPVLGSSGQPVETAITSIEQYRRTLLFQALGGAPAQIRALGGGATQFSFSTGTPGVSATQIDAAVFAGDEWRARPNLTVGMGLRYEAQTHLHDWRDVAPRLAIAWAPRIAGAGGKANTVLRAGVGVFYDRFALGNTITALRYNGIVQQQYTFANPDFFPSLPSAAMLAAAQTAQTVQRVSSQARAPYLIQSAVTLERQLPAHTTLALTYTNSHGVHLLRSNDINAPLPGTYNPNVPGSGVFPLGPVGPRFLMESPGIYNQNQLIANVKTSAGSAVSLFGFYVLNQAMSNSDGVTTFPANPYSLSGEYGAAATDIRQQGTVGGSLSLRWNMRVSPFLVAQSGAPFDITTGSDLYGTSLLNARPGIAADPSKPGVVRTSYGLLDPAPSAGEFLLPRNFGRGPAQINFNIRLAKTIGFGSKESGKSSATIAGGDVAGTANAAAGKRINAIIGTPQSGRKYSITFSLSARNVLNHTNPGLITGNITSPLFDESNQIGRPPNGEGFYETANNRRIEMQVKFAF